MDETETWVEGEKPQTTAEVILANLSLLMDELGAVNEGGYSPARAKKMAALSLKVQMDMLDIMADADARAKVMSNSVELEESKAYFDAKKSTEKQTENALKHLVVMAEEVQKVKLELIDAEKDAKKWYNSYNLAGSAHHFFKNMQG